MIPDQWTVLLWVVTAADWEFRHPLAVAVSIALGGLGVWGWTKAEPTAKADDGHVALDDLLTPTRTEEQ